MSQVRRYWPLIILFLLVIPAIRPLFHSGFFPMHDDQQVIRLAEFDQALRGGQFPPRWVSRLGFGYGYPLFIFYPPFVYMLGQIFVFFQVSYLTAVKGVFALAFFGSAWTMYLWTKHHFGRTAGFVSALFYTYVPYKAVDAYVRGALAELFSFVWLPLILLSFDRLAETLSAPKPKTRLLIRWGSLLSLSYALLMITHNLITLPFTGLLALYALFRIYRSQTKALLLTHYFLFLSLGLSLSAFFWLPSLAEKHHTLVDNILLAERYTYSLHYVQPHQLWNSIWGYAGSAPPGEIDGFSLKIGKLHIMLSLLAFLGGLFVVFKHKNQKSISEKLLILTSAFMLLLFSAFMTTRHSAFIWDHIQPLHYIQFPWRFLTFTALFSSLLAGATVWLLSQWLALLKLKDTNSLFVITSYSFLLIFLLLLPNLKYFQPQEYLRVTDDHYLSDDFAKWHISKTSFEFVPKDVATRLDPELNITQLDINRDQIATDIYTVLEGNPQTQLQDATPGHRLLHLSSATQSVIRFNTFAFPGWKATLNGQAIPYSTDNPLKLIHITVPAGDHQLQIYFSNTPVRTLANTVTLFSVILLLFIQTNSFYRFIHPKNA